MAYYTSTPQERRKKRVRGKMQGTAEKPRVSVVRSNKHIRVQAIDDVAAKTLVSAADTALTAKESKGATKTQKASLVGQKLASALQKKKITTVIFDRGQYKYHGRVKAVAEALREAGIKV